MKRRRSTLIVGMLIIGLFTMIIYAQPSFAETVTHSVVAVSPAENVKATDSQNVERLVNKADEIRAVIQPGNKEYIDFIGGLYLEDNHIVILATKKISALAKYENDPDIRILSCKYSHRELAASQQKMQDAIALAGIGPCGLDDSETPGLYAFGIDERANKISFSMRNINIGKLKMRLIENRINYNMLSFDALFTGTLAVRKGNLYKLPDTDSKVVTNLRKGHAITVKPFDEKWAEVLWNGQIVYIKLSTIKIAYSDELMGSIPQEKPRINIPVHGMLSATARANIRSGPGTRYKKIGILAKGENVNILGANGYWVKVEWKNSEADAYVHASYLIL